MKARPLLVVILSEERKEAAPPKPKPPTPTQAPSPAAKPTGRRDFLKLAATLGGAMAFAPFVPWGEFFIPRAAVRAEEQRIILPDGSLANVRTFPLNFGFAFPYPLTGDPLQDKEPFRQFVIIRLPKELGGDREDAPAFRAYSNICVHLWCLWRYVSLEEDPRTGRKRHGTLQCPCHGSVYEPMEGVAIKGPAALQTHPQNTLPKLDLAVDKDGFLVVKPPVWALDRNGIVGFGRRLDRWQEAKKAWLESVR